MSGSRKSLSDRFWAKVRRINDATSCWEWTGALHDHGYGLIGLGSRKEGIERAHRLSYSMHNAEIGEGLFVLHRCDNRKCVRPDHLFLGTASDNAKDMASKLRGCHGEKSVTAKLTEAQVLVIRSLRGRDSHVALARRYGVSRSLIGLIMSGQRWKHL